MKLESFTTDKQIGQFLKARRLAKNMPLHIAAKKMDCASSFLCELEAGKKRWLATDAHKYFRLTK